MRVKLLLPVLALALASVCAAAPPKDAAPKPGIDQLLAELIDLRKKKADAEKAEAATVAAIKAYVKDLDAKLKKAGIDAGPAPAPKPKPKPKPDEPPAPTPATGLRVVMVYESSAPLTREQQAVIYSPAVSEYLTRKCVKSAAGHPEWRRWDRDIVLAASESPTMRALWTDTKPKLGALPQLLIVNDAAGQLYPLPATEADALKLLKQYGGE